MTFKTRLPKLEFEIDDVTLLAVLTEWIRDTYELDARNYALDFVQIDDKQYRVTATFIDAPMRRPVSFTEIAEEEPTSNGTVFPPFTIRTPPQDTYTSSDVTEEHRGSDNSVPSTEVPT